MSPGYGKAAVAAALCALGLASPAYADTPPASTQARVESLLSAAPNGTRFGLLVVDDAGTVIASVNPDGRFIPASNTKMFTTAAAYALLPGMDKPDATGGTQVWLLPGADRKAPQKVVVYGRGDARMSSSPDCKVDCLAELADAVARQTKVVGDIVVSSSTFPDQRWSPGMSWNNLGSNDATAASSLALDNNELTVMVRPGTPGLPPQIDASPYVSITNEAKTEDTGAKTRLNLEHTLNSQSFRLYGRIPPDGGEWRDRIGIDDPAHYAGWTFAQMLAQRGVKVTGQIQPLYREVDVYDDPEWRKESGLSSLIVQMNRPIASLVPPPLADDVAIINKDSQNFHAEMLLRRIALLGGGSGSLEDGLALERDLFTKAGIPREGYDFSDGSGMSTYNRVSPRAAVALLRWISGQPWGKAWYASLPIAGVDGTLKRRFIGTPLANNLTAKTGTLNATNALSGTFRAASGKRLTFAFFANDVPNGQSAVATMEAVLLQVAGAN